VRVITIVAVSSVVFMAMTMAQEWQVFAPLLLGQTGAAAETRPGEVPAQLEDFLARFNTMLVHTYRFAGDTRFMDRLAAGDALKAEISADLDYLTRNGIVQSTRLASMKRLSGRQLAAGVYEIIREEEWHLEYLDHQGALLSERPMSYVITWRYVIKRAGDGWLVTAMGPAGT
jgi:hypothetical protein